MRALVTVYFWSVFALTAPVLFLLGALLFLLTAPFDPDRRLIHAYICRVTFTYLKIVPGWRVRIQGRELLPRGPCVIVANHQSMADILACMGLFHPFKFVSKASLFGVPLVGWMMTLARYVSVERGKAKSTYRMLESCRFWLRRGVPVLIYPEGTYSGGRQMLPFKRGAFVLAIEEQVPLVPVALRGTSEIIFEDGPWMNPRAKAKVQVLAPISPQQLGRDEEALSNHVRALLEAVP
ncbi:MAG: lysophospholipid acyltransferase family protein [Myxococcaceae bacterium]